MNECDESTISPSRLALSPQYRGERTMLCVLRISLARICNLVLVGAKQVIIPAHIDIVTFGFIVNSVGTKGLEGNRLRFAIDPIDIRLVPGVFVLADQSKREVKLLLGTFPITPEDR